jgi:hypothetical protein
VPARVSALPKRSKTLLSEAILWYDYGLDSGPDSARFEPGKINIFY